MFSSPICYAWHPGYERVSCLSAHELDCAGGVLTAEGSPQFDLGENHRFRAAAAHPAVPVNI